jgi:uncharacterized spore protein YtfJ
METQFNHNLEVLLKQLEHFITTKTVVGEPIHIGDTILVPLVDVSFGVGAGATATSEFKERNKEKSKIVDGVTDAGGGGLGAKINPTAILVIQNGTTQLINIRNQDSISKLIDMAPGIVSNFPDYIAKFTQGKSHNSPTATKKEESPEDNYHQLDK